MMVIPGSVRAPMRLLLQLDNNLLPIDEKKQLFDMCSHQDEISKEQGQWRGFMGLANVVKKYSNTAQPIDVVHKIACTVMTNSLPLHDPSHSLIGEILHPLLGLINHDCEPNVDLRCDVSRSYSATSAPNPILGSISIQATQLLKVGDEITLSYTQNSLTTAERQEFLRGRYFFDCTCKLCTDMPALSQINSAHTEVKAFASKLLGIAQGINPIFGGLKGRKISQAAMTALAETTDSSDPIALHENPYPALRVNLISSFFLDPLSRDSPVPMLNATIHQAILLYRACGNVVGGDARNLGLTWQLFFHARQIAIVTKGGTIRNDKPMATASQLEKMSLFAMMLLSNLEQMMTKWKTQQLKDDVEMSDSYGVADEQVAPFSSLYEIMVNEALESAQTGEERILWSRFRANEATLRPELMAWISSQMDLVLEREKTGVYWCPERMERTVQKSVQEDYEDMVRKQDMLSRFGPRMHPYAFTEQQMQEMALGHARGEMVSYEADGMRFGTLPFGREESFDTKDLGLRAWPGLVTSSGTA